MSWSTASVISLYVTFSALYHFHVDTKRIRKLPRQQRVILFKAIDEYWKAATMAAP